MVYNAYMLTNLRLHFAKVMHDTVQVHLSSIYQTSHAPQTHPPKYVINWTLQTDYTFVTTFTVAMA